MPIQSAINEGRDMLNVAKKRILIVGDNAEEQVKDAELKQLTYALYARIPKVKALHVEDSEWILSQNNIINWEQDLDAFEAALNTGSVEEVESDDVLASVPADMEWIDPKSNIGEWLYRWWPKATRNKHSYLGNMKIHNIWKVARHGDHAKFMNMVEKLKNEMPKRWNNERPLHQESARPDVADPKLYNDANVGLTFHGTRSVNVTGIINQNFRIPKDLVGVVITGAMFGGLLYLADDWKKSAGYTSLSNSHWSGGSGGVRGRHAFMFAVDAVLGVPHVAPGPKGYTGYPAGTNCIFGKAGHSGVANNEWVLFPNQTEIRYLAEFST